MQIQAIRNIAKGHDIPSSKLTKAELIRSIQKAEGNFDCFGSARDGLCDQHACSWREDCLPTPVSAKPAATKKASAKKPATAASSKAASKPAATAKPKAKPKATVKSKQK